MEKYFAINSIADSYQLPGNPRETAGPDFFSRYDPRVAEVALNMHMEKYSQNHSPYGSFASVTMPDNYFQKKSIALHTSQGEEIQRFEMDISCKPDMICFLPRGEVFCKIPPLEGATGPTGAPRVYGLHDRGETEHQAPTVHRPKLKLSSRNRFLIFSPDLSELLEEINADDYRNMKCSVEEKGIGLLDTRANSSTGLCRKIFIPFLLPEEKEREN